MIKIKLSNLLLTLFSPLPLPLSHRVTITLCWRHICVESPTFFLILLVLLLFTILDSIILIPDELSVDFASTSVFGVIRALYFFKIYCLEEEFIVCSESNEKYKLDDKNFI